MDISTLEQTVQALAQEYAEHNIAFLATAISLKTGGAPLDAFMTCQVLDDKSGCIPLAELCRDAAQRLEDASPRSAK